MGEKNGGTNMLTNKDYCDLETTKELELLGMNVYTSFGGVDVLKHVLLYEAQKWLREEKNMDVNAFYDNKDATWRFYILEIDSPDLSGTYAYKDAFISYEEALLEGIKEAIKIVKDGIRKQEIQNE